jgi:hypothetical protein
VRIKNIEMSGPQNPFFGGDRLFLYIHSAKTSIAGLGDYLVEGTCSREEKIRSTSWTIRIPA